MEDEDGTDVCVSGGRFDFYDEDGSGGIEREELGELLAQMGQHKSAEECFRVRLASLPFRLALPPSMLAPLLFMEVAGWTQGVSVYGGIASIPMGGGPICGGVVVAVD
eukprot:2041656-Rhodomonas_salina.1